MRASYLTTRLAAAVLGTAVAGPLGLAAAPAQAATCDSGSGVSVVVDFKGLGGGVQSVCDADGGGQKAASLFTGNGFDLTYAQRQPGYVCRVEAKPASDPCVNTSPANAYWGLWWSDGKNGSWTYASLGATSLTIPAGGSVAFAWDGVDGQATPGVSPPKQAAPASSPSATPAPTPTVKPTPSPTVKPTPKPTPTTTTVATPTPTPSVTSTETPTPTPSDTGSATPTPTASPTGSPTVEPSLSPTAATPTDEPTEATGAAADAGGEDGGLPAWAPVLVIVALFGAAATTVVVRRRSAAGPGA